MMQFRGVVAINQTLLEELARFLDERERELVISLHRELSHLSFSRAFALSHNKNFASIAHLLQLLDSFTGEVGGMSPLGPREYEQLVNELHRLLRSYLLLLEGGIVELSEAISWENIYSWTSAFRTLVEAFTKLFFQRLNGLISLIERVEYIVEEARPETQRALFYRWRKKIDSFVRLGHSWKGLNEARRVKEQLEAAFQRFNDRYLHLRELKAEAENVGSKIDHFLHLMAGDSLFCRFKELYLFLKLWKLDSKRDGLLFEDLARYANHHDFCADGMKICREYYTLLGNHFSRLCRELKSSMGVEKKREFVQSASQRLSRGEEEFQTLITVVLRLRDFALKTHPNPYVRSRMGFSGWVTGPEPEISRDLQQLHFEIEDLKKEWFSVLEDLHAQTPAVHFWQRKGVQEIARLVTALKEPFHSKHETIALLERLVHSLLIFKESSSLDPEAIDFVGEVLLRLLLLDWRQEGLLQLSEFTPLYQRHQKLIAHLFLEDDEIYEKKVREGFSKVIQWIKEGHYEKHLRDVEELARLSYDRFHRSYEELSSIAKRMVEEGSSTMTVNGGEELRIVRERLTRDLYLFALLFRQLIVVEDSLIDVRSHFSRINHFLENIDHLAMEMEGLGEFEKRLFYANSHSS